RKHPRVGPMRRTGHARMGRSAFTAPAAIGRLLGEGPAADCPPSDQWPMAGGSGPWDARRSFTGARAMSMITAKDGTRIYYKDWGDGTAAVFSHGWPLNADAWDGQMMFLEQHGFRVVAHDRRGHGRSEQASSGNDMDGYADDLAALLETLDLHDAALVGHSTGGGEVVRYVGRYGTERVAKLVLIGAIPPLMLKTPDNPSGAAREVFDEIRNGLLTDRAQYYRDLSVVFFGANRPGAKVSQGTLDAFWYWCMQAGLAGAYACVAQFSETDFTEDLKKVDVPTLVIHGDDDQIVPIDATGRRTAELVADAALIVYPGAPHGLFATHKDRLNADLLSFIEEES